MKSIFAAIIAVLAGLITLLGLYLPIQAIVSLKGLFLDWALTISAIALLIGIANLTKVHWRKLFQTEKKDFYSIFFFIGFFLTMILGIIFGNRSLLFQNFTSSTMIAVETSLMGVLALSLGIASFKLFQRKQSKLGIIFITSTVVFLISLSGFLSSSSNIPFLTVILSAINRLPIAGARGILLGISFGAIVTGLRVLMGFDRPYNR